MQLPLIAQRSRRPAEAMPVAGPDIGSVSGLAIGGSYAAGHLQRMRVRQSQGMSGPPLQPLSPSSGNDAGNQSKTPLRTHSYRQTPAHQSPKVDTDTHTPSSHSPPQKIQRPVSVSFREQKIDEITCAHAVAQPLIEAPRQPAAEPLPLSPGGLRPWSGSNDTAPWFVGTAMRPRPTPSRLSIPNNSGMRARSANTIAMQPLGSESLINVALSTSMRRTLPSVAGSRPLSPPAISPSISEQSPSMSPAHDPLDAATPSFSASIRQAAPAMPGLESCPVCWADIASSYLTAGSNVAAIHHGRSLPNSLRPLLRFGSQLSQCRTLEQLVSVCSDGYFVGKIIAQCIGDHTFVSWGTPSESFIRGDTQGNWGKLDKIFRRLSFPLTQKELLCLQSGAGTGGISLVKLIQEVLLNVVCLIQQSGIVPHEII